MEVEETHTAIGSDPNKSIHQHIDRSISEESIVGRLADWPISRSLVFVFAFAGAQTRSSPAASFAKAPSELSWYRLAKKIHPYIHPYIEPQHLQHVHRGANGLAPRARSAEAQEHQMRRSPRRHPRGSSWRINCSATEWQSMNGSMNGSMNECLVNERMSEDRSGFEGEEELGPRRRKERLKPRRPTPYSTRPPERLCERRLCWMSCRRWFPV
mmetsp:Transcript_9149/g.16006  ORF Transcript_9149/g.16006 Transcript_9149/m.16006 type:complete len:213 (-) Transcript_9149:165-803(-)